MSDRNLFHAVTRTLDWVRLRRLISMPTASSEHEGQLRYSRDSDVLGHLYLGRYKIGGTYEWAPLTKMMPTIAIGPFYINDLPGTATTQAQLGMFNTATAVSQTTNEAKMARSGTVIGMLMVADDTRTAGTATARVRVSGTGTAFSSGDVALDGTNTTSDSQFTTVAGGVSFTDGQTLGVDVVTSGWTPTTANVAVWLYAQLTAYG